MTQYSGKIIRKTPVTPTQKAASGVWGLTEQAAAIKNNTWPVAGVPDPISRSVRLRSSASAYLSRLLTSTTNQKTFTWSGWVKRGALGIEATLIGTADTPSFGYSIGILRFLSSDKIRFVQTDSAGNSVILFDTTAVFRDPSAWYHVVLAVDTTQATNTNGLKIWVNGVQQSGTFSAYTQNTNTSFNSSSYTQYVGRYSIVSPTAYFDGYMAETNFIDGQALTPSSFGTTDPSSGSWIPMAYTGTYGTNGFYLNFSDNSSTVALGNDYSGNSNNWTTNNISLTAGTTYDSMLDVPTPWVGYTATTDTSAVTRGNYAVWNPLSSNSFNAATDGNLRLDIPNIRSCLSNIAMSSGKWYCEISMGAVPAVVGIADATYSFLASGSNSLFDQARTYGYISNGSKRTAAVDTAYGASWVAGDIIGIAYDADAGSLTFYKNGVSQGVAFTGITVPVVFAAYGGSGTGAGTFAYLNAGQRPLSYTPPTGFKSLCTTNLPDGTIPKGNVQMDATLYTGNGSTQSVVNAGGFQPDFVWMKSRSAATGHLQQDSVRGVTKYLQSNNTNAEGTSSNVITSFNASGFSIGNDAGLNTNAATYVGWQWKANGSAVSNTNGSITSQVSANTTAGFSVVTYTGNGTGGATVGHGLSVAPKMVITKNRGATSDWGVYHASLTSAAYYLLLDTTAAQASSSTYWNSTAPTSSVFSIGTATPTNVNTNTYVAYCWSEVAGYSKFGSYTGNGSADGPFIYCGFRPKYVLVKCSSSSGPNWWIMDTSRDTYNLAINELRADLSNAELTTAYAHMDILSNGFKLRVTSTETNGNGSTYIFAAFAETPFKTSNAR